MSLNFFLAGCSGGQKNAKGDPLFGDHVPKEPSASPTAPTTSQGKGGLPPIPLANSSASNASLALATPLPGSRPLVIADPKQNVQPLNLNAALTSGPGTQPAGATLSNPQPIVVPLPRASAEANVMPAGSWGGPVPQLQANEFFLAQLRSRGVTWHKTDSVPGGIKFSCIVPNRENPAVNRIFEATAADFSTAVQAVLRQIDPPR